MLPATARVDDFVQVSNKDSNFYNLVGRINKITDSYIYVAMFGRIIPFRKEELLLKARVGSSTHKYLTQEEEDRQMNDLHIEDYNNLIDLALSLNDFEWVKNLSERKSQLKKSR